MGNEEKAQQGTPASASTKPEVTPPLKRNVLDIGITQSLIWKKIPLFKKEQWSPLVPKIPVLSVDFWQAVQHRALHYSMSDSVESESSSVPY